MLAKLVLAGLLAAVAVPALAQCYEDKTASTTSTSSTATPVASTDKPAPTSKPTGG